ncbi:hypothetical protein [Bifidobacterium longum]|uniref:hypothetical protein n=1 Tax=Bifidobacterium longum TaxID=216816 RepID=UPI0001F71CB8|nr:hypothetical protein [Bifidobacterium longum]BAJ71789.1 conserved hypothetical protein [Bifidobacterium longum subsp. infantis 157F]
MIKTAITLVRLRWTLTLATLRKSAWQTVAYVFSAVLAAGTIIGTGVLAWFIGILPPFTVNADGFPLNILGPGGIVNIVVVLVGATMTIFIGFIQLMMLGEGSTMNPRKFAIYGIADRNLQFGLLLSGLSGIPSLTGVASLMLWTLAYRHMGPAVIISSLLAAVLAVITMMSISKLVIALSTTLVTSKRGKGAFYIFIVLTFVIICQLPNILVNSGIAFSLNTETWGAATAIAAWTPFGAAFQLPFDALTGAWAVLIARIAILAVTWIVCFAVCTWCLRHERLTIGANSPSETAKGIGAFAWMPDSASGAVSARLITYLKRDPRQAMTFAMPVLFLIIFAFQAHGISAVVWQSLIWCGWFMSVVESNGLAYDGRGFTMEVIAGVRGRTDRIGRVRVYVGIMVVYMVLLYLAGIVLVGALTGRWAQPDDLATGLIFLAVGMGVALSGLGVAEVTSCVLMYPVASMDKPFSAPQGRAMAQGFFPFVYMLGSLLLMLPTGIVALVMLLTGAEGGMWLAIIPVALANGIGILALGTWLGGKLMDARMLSIVATLDSFASLQK